MTLPAASDFASYGGLKEDFTTIVDPLTDRSAAEVNPAFADTASMTRTCVRAYLQFTGSTGELSPNFHNSVWGSSVGVIPILVYSATGVYLLSFPEEVVDGVGETQSLNLSLGWGAVEGDTLGHVTVTKTGPSTFTVSTFNAAGAANDLVGFLINVFVI